MLACKSAFKIASKHFAKVQDEEVRKMFRRNMGEEAAKAFKSITELRPSRTSLAQ